MNALHVRGLDGYDPTAGVLRSSSVDDIAAWFLDTNYDGDAFFVRHAYFTGADDPYDKLRRALRADISDEACDTVNSTIGRSFPLPSNGRVAIKVINHYGDEVVNVVEATYYGQPGNMVPRSRRHSVPGGLFRRRTRSFICATYPYQLPTSGFLAVSRGFADRQSQRGRDAEPDPAGDCRSQRDPSHPIPCEVGGGSG